MIKLYSLIYVIFGVGLFLFRHFVASSIPWMAYRFIGFAAALFIGSGIIAFFGSFKRRKRRSRR